MARHGTARQGTNKEKMARHDTIKNDTIRLGPAGPTLSTWTRTARHGTKHNWHERKVARHGTARRARLTPLRVHNIKGVFGACRRMRNK